MATSTQQKQELFKAIWATAEDLRNSVDDWDFKSYVLDILFYRFISENITNYINAMQRAAGDPTSDFAEFSDEEAEGAKADLVREKGYNLSVSSYVEAEDKRPQTDIKELNARIACVVEHENKLRAEIDAIIKELESETL